MLADWTLLSEELQHALARCALQQAAGVIATQAAALALEMERGLLEDRGGPEALRLLARLVQASAAGIPGSGG